MTERRPPRKPSERPRPQVDRVVDLEARVCSARNASAEPGRTRCAPLPPGRRGCRSASPCRPSGGPSRGWSRSARSRWGGQVRVAASKPVPERRAGAVVVDDQGGAPAAYDAVQLGEPGLATGSEEVGPAHVHDVDAGVGQGEVLRGAGEQHDVVERARTTTGQGQQVGVRLDAEHPAGCAAKVGRWKPVPQPRSRTTCWSHEARSCSAGPEPSVGVDRTVLHLVGGGVPPDVGARDRAGQGTWAAHLRIVSQVPRPSREGRRSLAVRAAGSMVEAWRRPRGPTPWRCAGSWSTVAASGCSTGSTSTSRPGVVGLLGPSGCGKTTLLRCVVGVQRIVGGEVRVLGHEAGSPRCATGWAT